MHARWGPNFAKECIDLYAECTPDDLCETWPSLYPKSFFVRVDDQFTEVETKCAYSFRAIKKKLYNLWEIGSEGPDPTKCQNEGTKSRPIDISDLNVPLD